MTQRIPKAMKMIPEYRTLLNAIGYLHTMAYAYKQYDTIEAWQLQQYYACGAAVLQKHFQNNI